MTTWIVARDGRRWQTVDPVRLDTYTLSMALHELQMTLSDLDDAEAGTDDLRYAALLIFAARRAVEPGMTTVRKANADLALGDYDIEDDSPEPEPDAEPQVDPTVAPPGAPVSPEPTADSTASPT